MNMNIFNCIKFSILTRAFGATFTFLFLGSSIFAQSPPVINNVPADVTIDCVDNLPAPVDLQATDPDDATFSETITPVDTPTPGSIEPVCTQDTIFRVWTATNNSNMTTRDTQLIIILPDTAPPIINLAVVRDTAACEVANDDGNPLGYQSWKAALNLTVNSNIGILITDNCSGIKEFFNEEIIDSTCSTRELRFTFIDNCDQMAIWSALYTVIDTIPPTITDVPADTTVKCDDPYLSATPPVPTALDACSISMVPTLEVSSDQEFDGTCKEFQYLITRTWTVVDDCGNEASAQQVVSVVDLDGPSFNAPPDITISCEESPDLALTGEVTDASDSCGGNVTVTFSDQIEDGSCANQFTIRRNWTVRDVCGNISTKIQRISIEDTMPPTFTPPDDTTIDCSIGEQVSATGMPTNLIDNCGGGVLMPIFNDTIVNDPLCPAKYSVRRTWIIADSCGNSTSYLQNISVEDLQAPSFSTPAQNLILTCAEDLDIQSAFDTWLANRANATATDNCDLRDTLFAYTTNSNEVTPTLGNLACAANGDTVLMQSVDFIAEDLCGNRDTSTAIFAVIDDIPPSINVCQLDTTIFTDLGNCSATFMITPPNFEEDCSARLFAENSTTEVTLTSDATEDEKGDVPVNPATLNFPISTPLPVNAFTDASLTISLIRADAETASEFLIIKGEDGTVLGRTAQTDASCGNSDTTLILSKADFNTWAADGVVSIFIEPNIPVGQAGRFSVNDICENGTIVRGNLQTTVKGLESVQFKYRVNGGDLVEASSSSSVAASFDQGMHNVVYVIEDCAGNRDSCSFVLMVEDNEAPVLDCPDDIIVVLEQDTCSATVTLPFIEQLEDNCEAGQKYLSTLPIDTSDAYITYNLDPNLNTFLANEDSVVFTNVAANAISDVTLKLDLKGDFSTKDAFINIFTENDRLIGSTRPGVADCNNPGQANFSIAKEEFNTLAADGQLVLKFIPKDITVPPGVAGDGINPCVDSLVLMDGDHDGNSYIFATLEYDFITPSYYTTGVTETGLTVMSTPLINPTIQFDAGISEVFYLTMDNSGNVDTCSFIVDIRDEQDPVALCQPTTLSINPSGLDVQPISPNTIDAGSFDNCGIDTMYLSPNTFTCNEAGLTTETTLTVVDLMGNESSCSVLVRVDEETPMPTANSGICGGDTLFLIANPPPATGGIVYTYNWFAPSGNLISQDENPVIPNISAEDAGPYRVEVEGITGCSALGIVQVVIEELPLRPEINTTQNICRDETISLQSNINPNSSNVTYLWYEGLPPAGNLIQVTNVPFLNINGPHATGTKDYYLIIEADGCVSQSSLPIRVEVSVAPEAVVNESEITICAGEPISLGTFVTGNNVTYEWRGPNGFVSTDQFPSVIEESGLANAGVYSLIVSVNGCESEADFTVVNILPKPSRPVLVNNGPICTGENAILTTNNNDATTYNWISPSLQEFTTNVNEFRINNAQASSSGTWQVYVTQFGCDSDLSMPNTLQVNEVPDAIASAERTAVCINNAIRLQASPIIDGASYLWTGPDNYTSSLPNPERSDATSNQAGTYNLEITTIAGCSASSSINISIEEGVTITAVSNNGPGCLNGPTDIELKSTVFPKDNGTYQYTWTGPNSYSSTDSVAIIPGATSANNGNYMLEVTNGSGCVSNMEGTVVNVTDPPLTPSAPVRISGSTNSLCVGDTVMLETDVYSANTVTYHWETPNGELVTESPNLEIQNLTPLDRGAYSVYVTVDGCQSRTSRQFNLEVNSIPVIEATSNSPICSGDNLELSATLIPEATYNWSFPNGIGSSALREPSIPNTSSETHSGTYLVEATVNGCTSIPISINAEVMQTPEIPLVENSGPICISTPGNLLVLSVDTSSATSDASYSWFINGVQFGETTEDLNFGISNFEDFNSGVVPFRAQSRLGMCTSELSNTTEVVMDVIPNSMALAGPDREECAENEISLNASMPGIGTGRWTLTAGDTTGLIIANPEMAITPVVGLQGGNDYIFRWTLSNGACTNYSTDEVALSIVNAELPNAGEDQLVCFADQVILNATPPVGGSGRWSQSEVQRTLGVIIDSVTNSTTRIRGLEQGSRYSFRWTINGSCGEFAESVLVTTSDPEPFAGLNRIICNDDGTAMLEATPTAMSSTGIWQSLNNPNITFDQVTDPDAIVGGLQDGDNILVWEIDEGVCGDISRDTVILSYTLSPKAEDDLVTVAFGKSIEFDLLANDFLPTDVQIIIKANVTNGQLQEIEPGKYRYIPGTNFVGGDEMIYEICGEACDCSEAVVTFSVGENADCKAPNLITPNGDDINDVFVIPCLLDNSRFPESQVLILNEWGDEVYRSPKPYMNDWAGTYDGQELPVGTYFYIIDFGPGFESSSGHLTIFR